MTFQDIFRSSFLDNVMSVTLLDMTLAISLAFMLGIFIFWIYKKTYTGVMYSSSFGVALIALCMISTIVILAVTSNVVLSLGMVGALSIVRFRTAIKDPMDIVFLFWSIAVGIVLAAGIIPLAVFGSVFVGLILYIFASKKTFDKPYILLVHCENQEVEQRVSQMLTASVKKLSLKSKSVTKGSIELNFEIRIKDDAFIFVNAIADIEGVANTVLVSYNGDYMG
jgi:hypothetical protein